MEIWMHPLRSYGWWLLLINTCTVFLLYSGTSPAVAVFKHHSAPVTSVEWHPPGQHGTTDSTVFASASADDQVSGNFTIFPTLLTCMCRCENVTCENMQDLVQAFQLKIHFLYKMASPFNLLHVAHLSRINVHLRLFKGLLVTSKCWQRYSV